MAANDLKVLTINYRQVNLLVLSAFLKQVFPDVKILTATDGEKGIALARTEEPDLILLDIVRPGMDGFEVCRRLKVDQVLRDIPVILLTDLEAGKDARIKALEAGANGLLTDPIDEAELAAQVRALLKIALANQYQQQANKRLMSLVAGRTLEFKRELAERKRMEETLQVKNSAIESAIDAIATSDLKGNLTYVNPAFLKLWGYSSQADVLGKPAVGFWQMGDKAAAVMEAVSTRGGWAGDLVASARDGSSFDVQVASSLVKNPAGQPIAIMASFADITERKKAELMLRERVKELQAFYRLSEITEREGLTLDKLFQELVNILPLSLHYPEIACARMIMGDSEYRTQNYRESAWKLSAPVKVYGSVMGRLEMGYLEQRTDEVEGPFFKEERKLINAIAERLGRITERMQNEDKLKAAHAEEKKLRQQLEEEAKVRIRFIDELAHELKGPLTPILASAGILDEMLNPDTESLQKRLAGNILDSTRLLTRRLDELLEVARIARGAIALNLQPTDTRKFIEKVVSRFGPSVTRLNQQIIAELARDLPITCLDRSRLEQVMVNLLSNASKYSPEGSRILLRAIQRENELLISVKDQGIGISIEDQARLFQPYQRVGQNPQNFQGLGLGLALVKSIIEAHGGKVWVESQPGKGSIFSFSIPVIMQ